MKITMPSIHLVIMLLLAMLFGGCASNPRPAEIPSDQRTAHVYNAETQQLLQALGENDVKVIASSLESMQDQGSVIYADYKGTILNPDGTPWIHPETGATIQVSAKMITKLNSLQTLASMSGVKNLRFRVCAPSYLVDLPDNLKHVQMPPTLLDLTIESIDAAGAVSYGAEIREAAAKERAAIFSGLAELAEARGAVRVKTIDAVFEGAVSLTTATGEHILGRVGPTAVLEHGIEGAGKVVEAVMKTADGDKTVIADGSAADALEEAGQ